MFKAISLLFQGKVDTILRYRAFLMVQGGMLFHTRDGMAGRHRHILTGWTAAVWLAGAGACMADTIAKPVRGDEGMTAAAATQGSGSGNMKTALTCYMASCSDKVLVITPNTTAADSCPARSYNSEREAQRAAKQGTLGGKNDGSCAIGAVDCFKPVCSKGRASVLKLVGNGSCDDGSYRNQALAQARASEGNFSSSDNSCKAGAAKADTVKEPAKASSGPTQCFQGFCNSVTVSPDATVILTVAAGQVCPTGMSDSYDAAMALYGKQHPECSAGLVPPLPAPGQAAATAGTAAPVAGQTATQPQAAQPGMQQQQQPSYSPAQPHRHRKKNKDRFY